MPDKTVRSGSLQFYPRKRAAKILPSANWGNIVERNKDASGFLGVVCYKVGMVSVYVKDNTEDSMVKGKRIVIPGTIVECPIMKIYCVRFYKDKKVIGEIIVSNEKDLKRRVKVPKTLKKVEDFKKEFDDVRVIVYVVGRGRKPNMVELGLAGSKDDKLKLIKEKIEKGISVADVLGEGLVDVHGVTKGKGLQGPVKRFGITLKAKKSEKGQRRPGSLAPWNPSRVTFRAPQAGQVGLFSRIAYNNIILQVGKISEKDINKESGFHKYGKIKSDYVILKGSVPGPRKKILLLTKSFRGSKKKAKQKFEVLGLR